MDVAPTVAKYLYAVDIPRFSQGIPRNYYFRHHQETYKKVLQQVISSTSLFYFSLLFSSPLSSTSFYSIVDSLSNGNGSKTSWN
jgi:hypothetical protein